MKLKSRAALSAFLLVSGNPDIPLPDFKTTSDSPIHITDEGKLVYKSDAKGNRVPDFSYSILKK